MKSLFIFVLCVAVSWCMPQRFPVQPFPDDGNISFPVDDNNFNNFNIMPSSTSAPAVSVTTASPQYLACLQACPTTSEYNPVCGTDKQNYHNSGRLSCAQRCGKNVAAVRSGICGP